MYFGYTSLDPVIVVILSLFFLILAIKKPGRLMYFIPAALSLYFFIPFVTLLRLSDIFTLILIALYIFKWKISIPQKAKLFIGALLIIFLLQLFHAVVFGQESLARLGIRSLHYIGLFALFLFSWRHCQEERNYQLLVRGIAFIAVIHAFYSVYQIIAFNYGLPFRGIVRGIDESQIAIESIFFRINGLADEPKRLGYVLAIGALGLMELAKIAENKMKKLALNISSVSVFVVSFFTFSGSYFVAVALTVFIVALFRARVLLKFLAPAALIFAAMILMLGISDLVADALRIGMDRRTDEISAGASGDLVYRQEFYAIEYLVGNPFVFFTGTGIGQSNMVLNMEYGAGAGYYYDYMLPLNSYFLQLIFDLGGVATLLIYASVLFCLLRLYKMKKHFLFYSLLFAAIQSFTIVTIQILVVLLGAAFAQLHKRSSQAILAPPK